MKGTKTMIILRGAPGSGKSTLARQWQEKSPNTRIVVCMDSIRNMRGQYWIPDQEKWVQHVEKHAIMGAMDEGYDVCVDATNLNSRRLQYLETLAELQHYNVITFLINPGLLNCIIHDTASDRDHHVGEDVIRNFYEQYGLDKDGSIDDATEQFVSYCNFED